MIIRKTYKISTRVKNVLIFLLGLGFLLLLLPLAMTLGEGITSVDGKFTYIQNLKGVGSVLLGVISLLGGMFFCVFSVIAFLKNVPFKDL